MTGTPLGAFNTVTALAVDAGTGDIYVLDGGASTVDEFDAEGRYVGRLAATPGGSFASPAAVAVDSLSHHVFVGEASNEAEVHRVDVFGKDIPIPDVSVAGVASLAPTSVTLQGTVNPDGAGEAVCAFEYGTTTSYGKRVDCPQPVSNGSAPVGVSASVTSLEPDTTYHFRLDATNVADGETNTGQGLEDLGEFITPGPGLVDESAAEVTATSATLDATLDPHGAPTRYYFQYGRGVEYENVVPSTPASVGSAEGSVEVSRSVQGLAAGTVYHYRVVAVSELEVEPGVVKQLAFADSDRTFTTQKSGELALSDGRQWELVSQADKRGALLLPLGEAGIVQAASSGAALTYIATVPTFNATNCSPLAIRGTLTSTQGATGELSVPYQVTNCAVLAFKPKLTAVTSGKASRPNGASLRVKLTYPAGSHEANIGRVKVELPKALPSRLPTLQKACLAAVFEADPANCPAASIIGHATAVTPVLPVPLTGPAIFVSHGNESFPSLNIILQGYGVTVHLVGTTFISKKGVTSSTFKAVPDVPVDRFELTLPQGPYSALAANTNLCRAKLDMPTEFAAQNGALIKTTTKIQATGCPKARKAVKRKGAPHKGKRHARRHASGRRRG